MNPFFGHRSRAVWLALLAALVLGGLLYWQASQPQAFPAPMDFGEGMQTQAFWADDLRDPHALDSLAAAITPAGVTLSHLRELNIRLIQWSAGGPGTLYGASSSPPWHLIAYDLASGNVSDLEPQLEGRRVDFGTLTVAPDHQLYGLADEPSNRGADPRILFTYDPDAGSLQFLTEVPSTTVTIAAGPGGFIYGIVRLRLYDSVPIWPQFAYDVHAKTLRALGIPADPPLAFSTLLPQIGDEGLLYGTTILPPGRPGVLAVDLTSGAVMTQTPPSQFSALALRPGGGLYAAVGGSLWLFDSSQRSLTKLIERPETQLKSFVVLRDGRLFGVGYDHGSKQRGGREFLYTVEPLTGRFEELETLRGYPAPKLLAGPDNSVYTTLPGRAAVVIDPDAYAPQSQITSEPIAPIALILTRTVVGGSASATRALACTPGGRVYGVLSTAADYYNLYRPSTSYTTDISPYPPDRQWLFWYDPPTSDAAPAAVRPSVQPDVSGATALVALRDGRLVAGASDGRLFAYDPATGATRDFGKPGAQTWQVATLTLSPDGLVYGGTASHERATLFALNPDSGLVTDRGAGLPPSHLVGAVVVAPDGRVFASAGNMLVVYDPAADRLVQLGTLGEHGACAIRALTVAAQGQIYGGCGSHLLRYTPGDLELQDLGAALEARWYGFISTLVTGADGRLYGSLDSGYGSDSPLFVYDPATEQGQALGLTVPGSIMSLTTCSTGAIYAGSGTNHSMYDGPAYLFAFSPQCPTGLLGRWDRVTWDADVPEGTEITVDVLDRDGRTLAAKVSNGEGLSMIDALAHADLTLRATLSTHDLHVTPVLKHWRVDYTFQCQR